MIFTSQFFIILDLAITNYPYPKLAQFLLDKHILIPYDGSENHFGLRRNL